MTLGDIHLGLMVVFGAIVIGLTICAHAFAAESVSTNEGIGGTVGPAAVMGLLLLISGCAVLVRAEDVRDQAAREERAAKAAMEENN